MWDQNVISTVASVASKGDVMKKKMIIAVFALCCVCVALYFAFLKQNFVLYDEKRMEGRLLKIICQDQKLIFLDHDKQYVLMEGFDPSDDFDQPEITEFHGGVLIFFTWQTNKIGSSLELWAYDLESETLEHVFSPEHSHVITKYRLDGDELSLEELDFSAKIAIEDTKYQIPLEGKLEITTPLFFRISPEGELITERVLFTGACDWIKNRRLLSYYTWEQGKLKFLRYELPLDPSDDM